LNSASIKPTFIFFQVHMRKLLMIECTPGAPGVGTVPEDAGGMCPGPLACGTFMPVRHLGSKTTPLHSMCCQHSRRLQKAELIGLRWSSHIGSLTSQPARRGILAIFVCSMHASKNLTSRVSSTSYSPVVHTSCLYSLS
jgi:hypothetical protein